MTYNAVRHESKRFLVDIASVGPQSFSEPKPYASPHAHQILRAVAYVVCCMSCVACCMLCVACCMSYATCCLLHASPHAHQPLHITWHRPYDVDAGHRPTRRHDGAGPHADGTDGPRATVPADPHEQDDEIREVDEDEEHPAVAVGGADSSGGNRIEGVDRAAGGANAAGTQGSARAAVALPCNLGACVGIAAVGANAVAKMDVSVSASASASECVCVCVCLCVYV